MLLFTNFNHQKLSLNQLAIELNLRYGISISKQAIDDRFTQAAVDFIKSILEQALKIMIYEQEFKDLGILQHFTQLKIKDSTCFQLPENMAEKYAGSGGSGSGASIRIQFEYDFKTGAISDLSLHAFNNQDLNDAGRTMSSVQPNELVLRDLGYSKIEVFQQIVSQEAFFLSRLKSNITVYEKKGNDLVKIDFQAIEANMKETGQTFIEKQVYIGEREKLPVRLLIELMPEDKKQERLRTAQQTAKKKGRKIGKAFLARYGLNLFITNIDEQKMDGRKLRKLYLIRWQIELMFKTWKSIGEIHLVKK